MGFGTLALIGVAGLVGPLLAWRRHWHVPVIAGELLAGLLLGPTAFGRLDAADPTFTFLADIGFALVMFVAGSQVPIRKPELRRGVPGAVARVVAVAVGAGLVGALVAAWFDTGHGVLYAVIAASSSAAFILPLIVGLRLDNAAVVSLIPQVAIADTAGIVALPLAIEPDRAWRAAGGAALVAIGVAVAYVLLRQAERSGWRQRVHRVSEDRRFAVELRISLIVLFGLAALAVHQRVSILLAGFGLGLAVGLIGPPRRLARQLFALTEGFFGPLFFVWLGASLDLHEVYDRPSTVLLGLVLGGGAALAHAVPALRGQRLPVALIGTAQVGVPVAAVTVGTQTGRLGPGEGPALILGALVTLVISSIAGAWVARRPPPEH